MPLTAEFREFLASPLGADILPPPEAVSAARMREQFRSAPPLPVLRRELPSVRDLEIPGAESPITIRVYRPAAGDQLAAVMYFHGGGFVFGDLDSSDPVCREIAQASRCAVVSVDYRLAPETRFPGAIHDCLLATRWVDAHAAMLGLDASRLAVAGDSAGGNLAVAVSTLLAREGDLAIRHQALIYPVTDADCTRPSMREFSRGYLLTGEIMDWFWDCYAPTPEARNDPLASPLRSSDLAGLPPTTIITAEFDPLRDQGEAFAARLRASGVDILLRRYDAVIHGFVSLSHLNTAAAEAVQLLAKRLRSSLV